MEDGQEAGKFAPDREVDDPTDFEFNGGPPIEPAGEAESSADNSDSEESDEDAESDSVDDDANPPPAARGGTPTSSFEQFLAEWSDDDDGLSKLGVQLQLTQNLRRCLPSALPQPALHPPTPLARLPRRRRPLLPLGSRLVKPRPVGPRLTRLPKARP